jgi:predicted MFS family arabinose efflux permease
MPKLVARQNVAVTPDPQLRRSLRLALLCGLALVILLPMARGSSEWLGWLPMWLVGMPAIALWSLHRFRLPRSKAATASLAPRRRPGTQARRRAVPAMQRLSRAA